MNWIKENKFLSGFFAVLLLGLGALGYLLFTALGSYDEAKTNYDQQVGELKRLQNLPLTPGKKNLDALIAQKKEAIDALAAFQASLAAKSIPLEPMTPEKFQDTLKATKTAVAEKAAQSGTELPAKFFLGFDSPAHDYTASLPAPAAAAPLGRELKAIEWVLNQLFENRVSKLETIKREALPEEEGKKPEESAKKGGAPKARPLVSTHSFEIKMRCRQRALGSILNALTGPKAPQFYIPRVVLVKNEKDSVPKVDPNALNPTPPPAPFPPVSAPDAPAPAPPVPPAPPAPPKPIAAYIVGEEQVEVTLVIDIVDFAPLAPVAGK